MAQKVQNPYKPGSGHQPPHMAGRAAAVAEFDRMLAQDTVLTNVVLTGLRGVGKTVLLDHLRPIAIARGWLWVGTDLSESASLNEENIATRLLADLSVVTSSLPFSEESRVGFKAQSLPRYLDYDALVAIAEATPGLISDKVKRVLEIVWQHLAATGRRVIFAYDEAQNLKDHAGRDAFPLSLLLEVFQSIQKRGIPFMLVLTGLPTLFPKLVEARTFAERMFHVVTLDRLSEQDSSEAIERPISRTPFRFTPDTVSLVIRESAGYPYFIQFICRELFDVLSQRITEGQQPSVPIGAIIQKLDADFFAGRWARATDRQRQLLAVISHLENSDAEFSVQEIVELSRKLLAKPFGPSQTNQMLAKMCDSGLIYKNRHGRYLFAVPLMGQFIRRQRIFRLDQAN